MFRKREHLFERKRVVRTLKIMAPMGPIARVRPGSMHPPNHPTSQPTFPPNKQKLYVSNLLRILFTNINAPVKINGVIIASAIVLEIDKYCSTGNGAISSLIKFIL